jgi:hypothetical protein
MSEDDIATLRREHKEIKKTLGEIQKTTAFYQTRFGMADQILTAVKKGSAKSPSFTPEFLRDPQYVQTIRNLCVQAIYGRWNLKKEPSTLIQVYYSVRRKIQEMVNNRQWDTRNWKIPGRKTVDRRTEETAAAKHWPKEPPCLCVRAGFYCPNPALFDDETKEQILKIAEKWTN